MSFYRPFIIIVALLSALIGSNRPTSAEPNAAVHFYIADYVVAANGTVTARVNVDVTTTLVSAINIEVNYDDSKFTVISCDAVPNWDSNLCNKDYTASSLRMNAISLIGRSGNAMGLWDITFQAKSGATGVSDLAITLNTLTTPSGTAITDNSSDNGRLCIGTSCPPPTAVTLSGAPSSSANNPFLPFLLLAVLFASVVGFFFVRQQRQTR